VKGASEELVVSGLNALEEAGVPVRGAVVSDFDTPLGKVTNKECELEIITATSTHAGPIMFEALMETPPRPIPEVPEDDSRAHAFFNSTKALSSGEVMQLGKAATEALEITASDRCCVSITLCHSFGIAHAVGGTINAGAAVVLPAVGGIRGCGVPSQRAEVTLQVLGQTQSTLMFGDFHTLKALPDDSGSTDLSALRGGVVKCGSGTDFLDMEQATVGGDTRKLEYKGVTFKAMGKRA